MNQVFIGLGSNLDHPQKQLQEALVELGQVSHVEIIQVSPFYITKPVGFLNQPDFVNAVAQLTTTLSPLDLLHELKQIEQHHGRKRLFQNGPRTLDLDLLLYNQLIIQQPDLQIPHPRMTERAFVLVPLNDIAPEVTIPGLGQVAQLVLNCSHRDIQRLT